MSNRRRFLKQLGATGLVTGIPVAGLFAFGNENNSGGFVLNEEEQETWLIGPRKAPVTFMLDSTKGAKASCLCREEISPGGRIPTHKHLNEDEMIFIQYGNGIFTLGDKTFQVKAGSSAYVPKGIWHGITNTGNSDLRMVFSFTPSGFENYFREIGIPKGHESNEQRQFDWDAIDKKYGIVYKK